MCGEDGGMEDLEARKVYQVLPDREASREGYVRVIDESGEDWVETARLARRRKFGVSPPADFRERAKQARFLQYRGFSAEQVRAALGPGDDTD